MDYILGTLLILLAAASFTFLSGSTAVFIGIFGAVAGAVFIVRGIQANDTPQDPRQIELDSLNERLALLTELKHRFRADTIDELLLSLIHI